MKKLSFVLALLGVVLGTVLVGAFGFRRIIASLLSVGPAGFAAICVWQLVLFIPLGLAWDMLARAGGVRRAPLFIWGRMVRDASTNLLPFSQLGGFFFGARAVMLHGLSWPMATASTIVDLTTEFLAEVVFAAIGLAILLSRNPTTDLRFPLELGIGFGVLAVTLFVWLQRGASDIFAKISRRIAERRISGARQRVAVVQEVMRTIYRDRGRVALGFFLHLVGWIGTGFAGWIAFRLMGARLDVAAALSIEITGRGDRRRHLPRAGGRRRARGWLYRSGRAVRRAARGLTRSLSPPPLAGCRRGRAHPAHLARDRDAAPSRRSGAAQRTVTGSKTNARRPPEDPDSS